MMHDAQRKPDNPESPGFKPKVKVVRVWKED